MYEFFEKYLPQMPRIFADFICGYLSNLREN